MEEEAKTELFYRISNTFSPGAPINQYALFAGGIAQAREVVNAMAQRGQHVIIFGERGVGKTSLVNVLSEILRDAGAEPMPSASVNCDPTDDFPSLIHKLLRQVTVLISPKAVGFVPDPTPNPTRLDTLLPQRPTPEDVRLILDQIEAPSYFVLDELDRLTHPAAATAIADTIKTLSDHSVRSTLVLVGVADSVDQLVAQHASIERSLVQVRMPRMSRTELIDIVEKGLAPLEMSIEPNSRDLIASLSQGLPHYTHLLALHAAQSAATDGRLSIGRTDVDQAVRLGVQKAQQSILTAYHQATSSPHKTIYAQVLLACALAPTDQLGFFAASDVRDPLSRIMVKRYEIPAFSPHLNAFCQPPRGPVLQRTGQPRRFRFRFTNPLMQPFVILDGLSRGLIAQDVHQQFARPPA